MLNQRSPGLPGLVVLHLNLKAKQGTGRALAQDTSFNSAFTPAAFGLISMSFRFRCQFSSRRPVALFPVISVCSCDHTGSGGLSLFNFHCAHPHPPRRGSTQLAVNCEWGREEAWLAL